MHQIYDTVAKSGRNDLFESRLRLKTIGSASSYHLLINRMSISTCVKPGMILNHNYQLSQR